MSLDLERPQEQPEPPKLPAGPPEMRDWFPLFGARVRVAGTDIEGVIWGISPRGLIIDRPPRPLLTVELKGCELVEVED